MTNMHDLIISTIMNLYPQMKIRQSRLKNIRKYHMSSSTSIINGGELKDESLWLHIEYDYYWLDEGVELSKGEMNINISRLRDFTTETIKEEIDKNLDRELITP